MQTDDRLLIIGEVFVDVHLDTTETLCRLGGIFHSARARHAIQKSFSIAAITPAYLKNDVEKYVNKFNAEYSSIIGEINRCPNVMLINDSTEAGDQQYNDILMAQAEAIVDIEKLIKLIKEYNPTDVLIYPGKYDLSEILNVIKDYHFRIHVDFQYGSDLILQSTEGIILDNIILSTSSSLFIDKCHGSSDELVKLLYGRAKGLLLKENRGGSRYYSYDNLNWIEAPAFVSKTVHSVGVGDAFNAVIVSLNRILNKDLKLASYIASWYASTFDHESFVSNVRVLPEIKQQINLLSGIRLKWEDRQYSDIYIAGPDFPHIDTKPIDDLYNCLLYHNFVPHRPIVENGLATQDKSERKLQEIYEKDIALINKCSLLIAVLINNDPGTYVEIGWMANANKPTILFDPYYRANNLFLEKTVSRICHTLNEVISAVFEFLGEEEGKQL